MKVTQQEEAARQTVLEIELDDKDLEPYLNRGYRRVVQRVNVPGFRKGKAPRRIIERYFGREYLINEVIEYMVSDVTSKAIQESELDAGGLPRIDLKGLDPVQFSATVPLPPSVELKDYAGLLVERQTTRVTDEQVDETLERMLQSQATWEPVERATKSGDMVTADIEATVEGNTLIDQDSGVLILDDGQESVIPGLSEELLQTVKGEPKTFSLKLPDDYRNDAGDARLAGKEAHFAVTVREIKERIVPQLDDEFAKGVGQGFDNLAALRTSILDGLTAEAEQTDNAAFRNAAVAALVESADMTIAELLIDQEVDHIFADRRLALQRMNVDMDDYLRYTGKTAEEFRDEARATSIERLERTYALRALAEAEGIEVQEDELAARLESMRAAVPEDRLGEVDFDSDETVAAVRSNLKFEKVIDRLVEIVGGVDPAEAKGEENDG